MDLRFDQCRGQEWSWGSHPGCHYKLEACTTKAQTNALLLHMVRGALIVARFLGRLGSLGMTTVVVPLRLSVLCV